jgi:hypothetical protein
MSKRAEEKLCEACCPHYNKTPDECGFTEREMQWDCPYFDFIQRGYEQAEKDLKEKIEGTLREWQKRVGQHSLHWWVYENVINNVKEL